MRSTARLWVLVLAIGCGPRGPQPGAPREGAVGAESGGSTWTIETNPSPRFDLPSGVAVTADGLYVAGYEGVGGAWRVERRRLADGKLVWERRSVPGTYWGARDLAVDGEELFVAGDSRVEKRATGDGALVTSFGDAGRIVVGTRDGVAVDERIHAIVLDRQAMYLVGESEGGLWIQKRDRARGDLVTRFGSGGMWRFDPSAGPKGRELGSNYLLTAGLGADALVVGGFQARGGELGRIERLDPADGTPDPRFGARGAVVVAASTGNVQTVEDLAVLGDMIFVFVGDVARGHGSRWIMQRRSLRDGRVEWSNEIDPSRGHDPAGDLAVDRTGAVFVGTRGGQQWLVYETSLDGRMSTTTERDPGPGRDEATAVGLDPRWLYVAGFATVEEQDTAWRIERIARNADPRPVQSIAR